MHLEGCFRSEFWLNILVGFDGVAENEDVIKANAGVLYDWLFGFDHGFLTAFNMKW